jgi:hypothetical protein
MGFLHFKTGNMSKEEAKQLLKTRTYFDYITGRVMKVDLLETKLDTRLYNRDNGPDAAERAIRTLEPISKISKKKPKRMIQI